MLLLTPEVRVRLRTALEARVRLLDDEHLLACLILAGYTFNEIQHFIAEFL